MINFFTKINPDSVSLKNKFLERFRVYSLIRFSIREIVNTIIPYYFIISNIFKDYRLKITTTNNHDQLIVSLTSFPDRIHKLHLVIETVLRQTRLPNRIILWLSKEQFYDINMLPKKLLKLQERGLEIELCNGDLRSHKKYYYTLIKYPNAHIITLDDDILYTSDLIEILWNFHIKYPQAVKCVRAYENINLTKEFISYKKWKLVDRETNLRGDIFPTSGAGTLYPAGVFYKDVLKEEVFMEYCKYADDIWLFFMVLLNDKKFVKVNYQHLFLPILYKNNRRLTSINVNEGGNDRQLLALRDYYITKEGIDILDKII